MWYPGASLAVTRYETVSPALATSGSTEVVSMAVFGRILGLLSFLAGLGAAVLATEGGGVAIAVAGAGAGELTALAAPGSMVRATSGSVHWPGMLQRSA